ncbi:MAG: outer membrane lipoprotein-sorting protein [Candidatus Acetothermia bacterium]|jgi:hypothetical protein|nr:outer membrane lipoprotein-sorting protein [Candidatus Acetothermia bacterium]
MKHGTEALLALAMLAVPLLALGQGITADDILAKVEDQGFFGTGRGNLYGALAVTIEEPGQAPVDYAFRVWAKEYPDGLTKTLLLYAAPEAVAGTMYLAHIPEEGMARMWLWLPALELVKELVGEEERKGEFISGSGITYDDVAQGFSYREDYTPQLVGEEAVGGHPTWVLALTPKGAKAEWARIRLWVHKDAYLVLKVEFYDRNGALARVLFAEDLVEDALGLRPSRLVVEDRTEKTRAVVEIQERSEAEIPDAYFLPENLPYLAP